MSINTAPVGLLDTEHQLTEHATVPERVSEGQTDDFSGMKEAIIADRAKRQDALSEGLQKAGLGVPEATPLERQAGETAITEVVKVDSK